MSFCALRKTIGFAYFLTIISTDFSEPVQYHDKIHKGKYNEIKQQKRRKQYGNSLSKRHHPGAVPDDRIRSEASPKGGTPQNIRPV
jgi:hypothetical protein